MNLCMMDNQLREFPPPIPVNRAVTRTHEEAVQDDEPKKATFYSADPVHSRTYQSKFYHIRH